jgi:hypothetical protein
MMKMTWIRQTLVVALCLSGFAGTSVAQEIDTDLQTHRTSAELTPGIHRVEVPSVGFDLTMATISLRATEKHINLIQYQSDSEDVKPGFFRRYRYWIIGGVTAAVVGTYLITISGSDSPPLLPEPPPRPN